MIVYATREGLVGGVTASGYRVDRTVPFVALPSIRALQRFVWVHALTTGRTAYAIVLDVGPWNTQDDAYVFHGARPQAESGTDTRGRRTNRAGIDLGEWVWHALGLVDNSYVDWGFLPPPGIWVPSGPQSVPMLAHASAATAATADIPTSTSAGHILDTVAA